MLIPFRATHSNHIALEYKIYLAGYPARVPKDRCYVNVGFIVKHNRKACGPESG